MRAKVVSRTILTQVVMNNNTSSCVIIVDNVLRLHVPRAYIFPQTCNLYVLLVHMDDKIPCSKKKKTLHYLQQYRISTKGEVL